MPTWVIISWSQSFLPLFSVYQIHKVWAGTAPWLAVAAAVTQSLPTWMDLWQTLLLCSYCSNLDMNSHHSLYVTPQNWWHYQVVISSIIFHECVYSVCLKSILQTFHYPLATENKALNVLIQEDSCYLTPSLVKWSTVENLEPEKRRIRSLRDLMASKHPDCGISNAYLHFLSLFWKSTLQSPEVIPSVHTEVMLYIKSGGSFPTKIKACIFSSVSCGILT